ncbi:hypothetical protein BDZ91DRAFT_345507 [Kalaharituber pfeilii]|nr:hypothetical protein BDZ91DRAFT_345507 [Kalaharituber pfeilii]
MSSQTPSTQTTPPAENNEENEKERSRIVRLRENKRRSRARQKEYVQQLERRCREYEQAHVQATVEMQAAARKVASENRLLRALLKKMGADDHLINSWLEGHTASELESHTANLPLRRRSRSTSTVTSNGPHLGDGLQYPANPGMDSMTLDHTQHYPMMDQSSPTSPSTTHNIPLLLQPVTQPTSPQQHGPPGLAFTEDQLQPFTYSPTLTFTSAPSPTAPTVASSPQLTLDSNNYHSFFPTIPQAPIGQIFSATPAQLDTTQLSIDRKPLVFIRLDPTNDLYKLYPMSTIAIIPWLLSSVPTMQDQEVLQAQLANLNIVGMDCQSPQSSTGETITTFPSGASTASTQDFDGNIYAHHFPSGSKDENMGDLDPGEGQSDSVGGWM